MRTTAVLVILLLVVGLNLGASGAQAGDHAVIQPLPTTCQPVSDVELSRMRGGRLLPQFWLLESLLNTAHRAIKGLRYDISKVTTPIPSSRMEYPTKFYRASFGFLAEAIYLAGLGTPAIDRDDPLQ